MDGEVTAISFFESFTASVEGVKNIEVTVHSGSADSSALTTSEAGTYTVTVTLEDGYVWEDGTSDPREYTFIVTLTLNEGYTWADGTEGDETFTFIVYEAVELTFGTGFAYEGIEDGCYVYAYDSSATTLFSDWSTYSTKLTAYDAEGNEITDLDTAVPGDYETIRFALEDEDAEEEQSGKWEQTGEYTYTISLDELTDESGTVTAISFFEGLTTDVDGVANIEVTVHSGSADSDELTTSEAGTYTVTVTLEDGYVWEDGTSDPKEYTFTVTE